MAEIINLRQKRKAKTRKDKVETAENNRVKFGRTKLEKKISAHKHTKDKQNLDGKKLDN